MDIAINSKWVSGNTFNPTHETVIALLTWGQLSPSQKSDHLAVCYWETEASMVGLEFVVSRREGYVRSIWMTGRAVFEATRYESVDAMAAAYAKQAQSPGAHLPGE